MVSNEPGPTKRRRTGTARDGQELAWTDRAKQRDAQWDGQANRQTIRGTCNDTITQIAELKDDS